MAGYLIVGLTGLLFISLNLPVLTDFTVIL
jgi:hypothetical protein